MAHVNFTLTSKRTDEEALLAVERKGNEEKKKKSLGGDCAMSSPTLTWEDTVICFMNNIYSSGANNIPAARNETEGFFSSATGLLWLMDIHKGQFGVHIRISCHNFFCSGSSSSAAAGVLVHMYEQINIAIAIATLDSTLHVTSKEEK